MSDRENRISNIEPAQLSFASMLVWLVRIGLGILFVTFIVYASGLVPSVVTIADVPDYWHLSAEEYAERTNLEIGWAWVGDFEQGRTLVFAGLVFFPAGTMVLIGITVALYLRQKVPAYALIAFLELIVLIVAATGLLSTGR